MTPTDVLEPELAQAILYRHGNEYTQAAASSEVVDRPEAGVYSLNIGDAGIQLVKEENYSYTFPKELYGNVIENGDNVLRTWTNRSKNTGVLLSGAQGTGKSLTAQYIINKAINDMGAVVIDFHKPILEKAAFNFIQNLRCPVIIFIDEFEKKYNMEDQEKNLSYMDGSSLEGVLWLLTVNRRNAVGDYYLHRPSRVYFHFKFDNVDMETIEKIVDEKFDVNLYIKRQGGKVSKEDLIEVKKELVKSISTFSIRTFDTILSFISEVNATGNSPSKILSYLNISIHQRNKDAVKTCFRIFSVGLDDQIDDITKEYQTNRIFRFLRFNDVFGDGKGQKADDWTEIPIVTNNKVYPSIPDFKMDSDTFVETENYDILKFRVGETVSGKPVFIEFSKKPFPAVIKNDNDNSNDNTEIAKDFAMANISPVGCF